MSASRAGKTSITCESVGSSDVHSLLFHLPPPFHLKAAMQLPVANSEHMVKKGRIPKGAQLGGTLNSLDEVFPR